MSKPAVDYAEKNKQLLKELLYETKKMSIIIRHESKMGRTNKG